MTNQSGHLAANQIALKTPAARSAEKCPEGYESLLPMKPECADVSARYKHGLYMAGHILMSLICDGQSLSDHISPEDYNVRGYFPVIMIAQIYR